ncbi:TPA: hypothetical protein N2D99_002319 [Clostridium botulinum]|nr:hypothetical protein [Clostridium botulinum]
MVKNKLTIALLVIGMTVGIGLTIWFVVANPIGHKKTKVVPSQQIAQENKQIKEITGMSDEEVRKLSKDEREGYLKGDGKDYENGQYKIEGKNKQEYPNSKTDRFAKELILKAQSGKYSDIISKVSEQMKNYNFTEGKNLKISSIYYDASIMINTLTVPEIQKGKIVKGMKNPEMLVIGSMQISEKSRRDVIYDFQSLSPIVNGEIKIINHEVLNMDNADRYVQSISNILVGADRVHKIEFSIEGKNLYAYIVEYKNATLQFYGIYAPEDVKHNFKTIEFWAKMDENYEKMQNNKH